MNSLGFNKKNSETKVIVAMSGGVDSSVAAVMLKKQGYDVSGITLRLYNQVDKSSAKSCCAGRDIEDAKKVAEQFDFPHQVLDYQEQFFSSVIDNFVDSYAEGETPIPCVKCNETVKFRDLLSVSKNQKADALITGHYIRRVGGLKNSKMFKAKDASKDQSYFLFSTTKDQLDYLRFPIGEFYKSEIRGLASEFSLNVKDKPDSQDICFVSKNSYRNLIQKLKPESFKKGKILDIRGKTLGDHEGIVNYTVGQRKGIGIGGFIKPQYVIDINKEKNTIILGEEKYLKKTKVSICNINWITESFESLDSFRCYAKVRSTQAEDPGILKINGNKGTFEFDKKINSISPGQACVFYQKDQVLGGGWITKDI